MDRRVTSPTWSPPPPCKHALRLTSRRTKGGTQGRREGQMDGLMDRQIHTSNCNNVVLGKWKKERTKLIWTNKANQATFSGWIHLQPLHFPAGFFLLFFSFKTIANSNRKIWCPCADAANKFIRLICLINSYLAFSLLHFFHDNVFAIRCR